VPNTPNDDVAQQQLMFSRSAVNAPKAHKSDRGSMTEILLDRRGQVDRATARAATANPRTEEREAHEEIERMASSAPLNPCDPCHPWSKPKPG